MCGDSGEILPFQMPDKGDEYHYQRSYQCSHVLG